MKTLHHSRLTFCSFGFLFILFSAIACVMVTSLEAVAATYYLDASAGSDGNDGLSPSKAWQTLQRIAKTSFVPGDSILFKKGESWNGIVDFKGTGQENSLIIFGAYGDSNQKPKITNKSLINSWISLGNNIFKYETGGSYCYGLFEDGNKIKVASDASLIDGNWFFDGITKTIFYKSSTGLPSSHVCEYSNSSYVIRVNGGKYICISNIAISYAGGGIVVKEGSSNITIQDCELHNFYHQAIAFNDTNGACSVIGNSIINSGDGVYLIGDPGNNFIISNNTFSYMNYYEYNNKDGHAIGIQNSSNNVIEKNYAEYSRAAIAIYAEVGKISSNNLIRYNTVANCKKDFSSTFMGHGIGLGGDADNTVVGNKIYYNIIYKTNRGIKLKYAATPGNDIYNNTIYMCDYGIQLSNGADNNNIINNIISNSTYYHIFSEHSNNGVKNTIDHNLYFPDGVRFMDRSIVKYSFGEWRNTTSHDIHSVAADPRFLDSNSFTLRPESPAINSGKYVGIEYDFSNKAVPSGAEVDIGALEHAPLVTHPSNVRITGPK